MSPALISLQSRLQHQFSDPSLLVRAVTHRSFSADHNERLEFLGDSVLSLAVASLLYVRLRSQPEGDLSRVRANLVKEGTLHQLALGLRLSEVLRLGEGESRSGGPERPSILADALEALIGAVYLDAGYGPAEALVHRLFAAVEINPQMQAAAKDAKTALQEWLQGRKMKVPQYSVVATAGAAHRQTFDVECHIPELSLTERGTGGSRRAGEQAAATAMLATLKAKKTMNNATKNVAANAEPEGAGATKDLENALSPEMAAALAALVSAPTDAPADADVATGPQRCGVIAIVGKPNVGKSTLLNALVGQKISITSRKAQTTRHRITGIRTMGQTQFVFVDTPGFQTRHATALNKSLNKTVMGAIGDVDLILFVVEAGSFTPADAKVLSLFKPGIPTLLLANKLDNIHRRAEIAPWLQSMQERHPFAEFVPMSAKNKNDIGRLYGICQKYLPEAPWWYEADELTDRSEKFLASETVREKLFRFTGDELPYTSTVVIEQFGEEKSKNHKRLVRIAATIIVERDSHKAMVIGDKGERLKRIGTETRQELEKLMDAKVFLELWVKVRSGWADDEARVRSFGYE